MKHLLFSIVFFLTAACGGEKKSPAVAQKQPVAIVIGRDISQSFEGYSRFNPQHIYKICKAVMESGIEGLVAFQTIGNPTDSSFMRCVIHAAPALDPNATYSQKAKHQTSAAQIKAANEQAIAEFVAKCTQLSKRPLESNTDLNGFLAKADRLLAEPQFNGFAKYLYVHTDGLHSVGRDTALVNNIAGDVQIYVSGWKNTRAIGNNKPMESSDGFVSNINHLLNL